MGLTAGIIGIPNSGKTTLFNAITASNIESTNYPFATVASITGTVVIKDKRIDDLTALYNPKKKVYANFEVTDIAGLVKGSSRGEGLGNKFLAVIREVDALVHIVRCFDDENVIHVSGSIDPVRDIEEVNLELVLADEEIITKRLERVEKKALVTREKELVAETSALKTVLETLKEGLPARKAPLTPEQIKILSCFNLLTLKPVIYVANLKDNDIKNYQENNYYKSVLEYANNEGSEVLPICAKVEEELVNIEDEEEKNMFLEELNITESGLDKLVKAAFSLLGLSTFFTVGKDEVRAWTFKNGSDAAKCAGVIHSDFEKGFIKAEVFTYEDIMAYKTEQAVKEAGKFRLEGKNYLGKDGDIMHFRFNL